MYAHIAAIHRTMKFFGSFPRRLVFPELKIETAAVQTGGKRTKQSKKDSCVTELFERRLSRQHDPLLVFVVLPIENRGPTNQICS